MITDQQRIEHILKAIDKIIQETSCEESDFYKSETIQDAVSYNFMIIGEAANKLSNEFKNQLPDVPWRVIIGMRNILVHDYCQTDYKLLWQTAKTDIPSLKEIISKISC
ncbi:MAG: DUF86 domain-containing protein [Alphaproteobacteria bacterium]|nr:DUF86 domain-containing protein [Alphaproteobacteria bacterium]